MNKDHVIVEAKAEYTKQLISLLTQPVYDKLISIYQRVDENTKNKRELLINIQKDLKQIPVWNQAQIDHEVDKVTRTCSWIGDLVAAIFISNVKILTSVKIGKDKKKIQITMPKTDQFIHKVFIETAAKLYDNPFVFQASNRKPEIIMIIRQSIEDTIRTLLPFQNILQSYLGETLNSPSESESDSEQEDDFPEPHKEPSLDGDEPEEPDLEPEQPDLEPEQPPPSLIAQPEQPALVQQEAEPFSNPQPSGGFFDPPQEEVKNVQLNDASSQQMKQQQRFFDDADTNEP